ncbi:hypothetical protein [Metabacillus herbersteinensis]
MQRKRGKWNCPICEQQSTDAHIATLKDYALLIEPIITNQKARVFLQIESPTVSNRILTSEGFPASGGNKDRKYHLIFNK